MNIYKLTQTVNTDYDTFDAAIVAAENAECAQQMHPGGGLVVERGTEEWADPKDVTVELIGTSTDEKQQVLLASFNAG